MRSKWKRLALAMMLTLPPGAQAQVLSFEACVKRALAQNPEIGAADQRIAQAQAAYEAAKNSRLPQINTELNVINTNDALNVFGMKVQERQATFRDFGMADQSKGLDYAPRDLNRPGDWTHYNAKLQILIPVWNGGKISGYQDMSKAMMAAAQHGKEAVRQFLTYSVFRAYDAVHTARSYIDVSRKALEAAESYVRTTRNMVEQGVVVKSELLRALVNRSEAQLALEQAQNQEQLALDALRTLLAMDMGESLVIEGRVGIDLPSDDVAEMVDEALKKNPKLIALRKQYEAALAEVRVAQADRYPHVNVMAEANAYGDAPGSLNESAYTVAAQARWKLADFGVTRSNVDRFRAKARELGAKLASEENQIRLKVIQAWRNYGVTQKKIETTRLNARQAEEANRLVLKRYKAGVATITELLASQAQLDKARADNVAAIYEANIHKAELRFLTGGMTPEQLFQ